MGKYGQPMAILAQNGGSGRSDTVFGLLHMLGQGSDSFAKLYSVIDMLL